MRRFVHDADTSFVPPLFVLYPEALSSMMKRDKYIRSTWPLWLAGTSALTQDPVEAVRCELQEVCRVNGNRLLGAMEAILMGDLMAGLAHILDAYFHLTHVGAETDARRKAVAKGNNSLLKERDSIQSGAASSSSEEVMLSLAKRNQAQDSFFRTAGSATQTQPTPAPSYPPSYFAYTPTSTSPFTYFPTSTSATNLQASAVLPTVGAVPVQQESRRSQKRWNRNNRFSNQFAGQQFFTPAQNAWQGVQPLQYVNPFQQPIQNFGGQGRGRGGANQRGQRGFFNQTRGRGRGASSAQTVGMGILPSPTIAALPPADQQQ